jgi:hypothetical protein
MFIFFNKEAIYGGTYASSRKVAGSFPRRSLDFSIDLILPAAV